MVIFLRIFLSVLFPKRNRTDMKNVKEEIDKSVEGMLPEISQSIYSTYKSILIVALIFSAIPLISYLLFK